MLARRKLPKFDSVVGAFTLFLEMVAERARAARVGVNGHTHSDAAAKLGRMELWENAIANSQAVTGQLLINEAYAVAALQALSSASTSISLMMFLTTDASGVAEKPGPNDLINALVAGHDRGVVTRVILDQDDDGFPYNSANINREVFRILTEAGVAVRYDRQDTLLHSKVLLVDNDITFVGAHNWTRAGLFDIYDISVMLQGAGMTEQFQERFDMVWQSLES